MDQQALPLELYKEIGRFVSKLDVEVHTSDYIREEGLADFEIVISYGIGQNEVKTTFEFRIKEGRMKSLLTTINSGINACLNTIVHIGYRANPQSTLEITFKDREPTAKLQFIVVTVDLNTRSTLMLIDKLNRKFGHLLQKS